MNITRTVLPRGFVLVTLISAYVYGTYFSRPRRAQHRVERVFKAIDQARARLQKADNDLEELRNELSYKEERAALGR